MVEMFGQVPGVYQDAFDISQHEAVKVLPEHLINESLDYGGAHTAWRNTSGQYVSQM